MAEDSDYSPGNWSGHNFGSSVRSAYAAAAPARIQEAARTPNKKVVPQQVSTQATAPLVVAVDVTGSMGVWPATIFGKLPYLDIEGRSYLGADMEISFAAVGDYEDKWPIQVQPFTSGVALRPALSEILIEGGGGGNMTEAYELTASYYANKCALKDEAKPIIVFVADEGLWPSIGTDAHKYGLPHQSTAQIFKDLQKNFAVYLIYKRYRYADTRPQWVRMVGEDHIADLEDPDRVIDVIFGILAKETGKVDYFRREIEGRQTSAQVQTVMQALRNILANSNQTVQTPTQTTVDGTPVKPLF